MRNCSRLSAGSASLRAAIACCSATAQRSASSRLANSARNPSPLVLAMRPRWCAISGRITSRSAVRIRPSVPSSSRSTSRV